MSNKGTSNKGRARLAGILQGRMGKVKNFQSSPTAELGILRKNGLILDSFPDDVIENGDYMICQSIKMQTGNSRVLVVWAGETAIVVDVLSASGNGD